MPSRAETRGWIETALRAISVAIIAFMLWQSLDHGRVDQFAAGRTRGLGSDLREWTRKGIAPKSIAVQLDSAPSPRERDWLAALHAAGSAVSWNGALPPVGVDVQPVASPAGGYHVLVSAPSKSSVVVADEIGPIDRVSANNGGGSVSSSSASGIVTATAGGSTAQAILPDTLKLRRVLVIGSADWESKFVIAALEEDGWKVDARTHLAPGVSVTQGSTSQIDTSRYSAVIALDGAAAADGGQIVRYAASGGGVIIAAGAVGVESLSPLRAGAAGRAQAAPAAASEPGSVSLQSLSITPISAMKNDAVTLEKRGANVVVAARRFGAGRVMQVGYVDTWRWRMSGGENSVAAHRQWWTHAVAGVAYATPVTTTVSNSADNAPVARLIEALGKPAAAAHTPLASTAASVSLWWLFVILSLSLLAEWVSRRTRGVR